MGIVNDHTWVSFFTHTVQVFWVRSLDGRIWLTLLSNFGVKLARNNEMFFNISITSPMRCPSVSPKAWIPFGILLELSWSCKESVILSAWSLKQFGLVWPCIPQWWQKCFTWGPLLLQLAVFQNESVRKRAVIGLQILVKVCPLKFLDCCFCS